MKNPNKSIPNMLHKEITTLFTTKNKNKMKLDLANENIPPSQEQATTSQNINMDINNDIPCEPIST